ncbi:MAG: formylglycine-generating enzyme family protein [Capsulimonadaceae bacterium]
MKNWLTLLVFAIVLPSTRVAVPAVAQAPASSQSPVDTRVASAPESQVNPTDGAEMVYVPAGEFTMGDDVSRSGMPERKVTLDGYYIYKNLVTVAQYKKFCDATRRSMPRAPSWGWDKNDYPIVNVSWYDAQAYAQWAGVLLPTEAQWEKAARGVDGRIYPWGNVRDAPNLFSHSGVTSIGKYPDGASPYGVLDMAGSVAQWCSNWSDNHDTQCRNPAGPATGTYRAVRGMPCAVANRIAYRATYRSDNYPWAVDPGIGFRCVFVKPDDPIAHLHLTGVPEGARISVDGVARAGTSIDLDLGGVDSKSVKLVVAADNSKTYYSAAVSLQSGVTTDLPVTMISSTVRINPTDGAEMVYVPAGEFTMGDADNAPAHRVFLDGYYIYKNLVTEAEYRRFCVATGHEMPPEPWWGTDKVDYPAVKTTWEDAEAYAQWAGASLPTEAQWEKAARGTDGRQYPWGNDWNPSNCRNFDILPTSVGSYPDGASPYGVLDMAGNVSEWCSDWFDTDYYSRSPYRNPAGPLTCVLTNLTFSETDGFYPNMGVVRVVRGGSWHDKSPIHFRSASRDHWPPEKSNAAIGFRCVVPPPVTAIDTKAYLRITGLPADARITVDGVRQAGPNIDLDLRGADAKSVRLEVVADNYRPYTATVPIQSGFLKEFPIVLQPEVVPSKSRINPIDGAELVYVPAGEFTMGSLDSEPWLIDSHPPHEVALDGFYIDRNLVTVARYRKFCDATGRPMPPAPEWGWRNGDYPMVDVTWDDAQAYAQWAGGSLPTEAQWEKAAQGTDGRRYPWGNDWDPARCLNNASEPAPVGSKPSGASPYGVLDMAGNAWEWCSDWFDAGYYSLSAVVNPIGPPTGTYRILRGGSWLHASEALFRTACRGLLNPADAADFVGFRCVVNPAVETRTVAHLNLIGVPGGARITVDGVRQSGESTDIDLLGADSKKVTLAVDADKYYPFSATVVLQSGVRTDLPIVLEPIPLPPMVNPVDGAEMVYIPAGEFTMGEDAYYMTDAPAHRVFLTGYYIYKSPVTVAMYRAFCSATGRAMPPASIGGIGADDTPILAESWYDAQAYAQWAGVSLPTEAQWEKAAGTKGREYQWKNDWTCPYGLRHIMEWCADWYDRYYYNRSPDLDPTGPATGDQRVVRGSESFSAMTVQDRAANRYHLDPNEGADGFRCVFVPPDDPEPVRR